MTSRVYRCFCQSAVVFHRSWSSCIISSQFVLVYSPLISSIVDFVCSSYQAHYYSSITVRSPLWSELGVEFFLYWDEVVLGAQLRVCLCRSPQIGCVFIAVKSILSINSAYSLLRGAWVGTVCCSSTVRSVFWKVS